ncbi:MAG: phenylalanine--tRNA ligase subunit beta [Planctomycetes bacterium]|nr:phenylalanine--tRNA ligase subunit beta [Planctomycetota bacterium]
MPHVTFPLADLRALSGIKDLTLERLDELALLVKGELKLRASTEEEVKVELQDTNRPDTWCVEGIARQLRQHRAGEPEAYPCFAEGPAAGAIEVDPSVEGERPYVAGFLARDYTVDDAGLKAFITAQEVLCQNFGRKRKAVAIGIYDASQIEFPVRYQAVPRDGHAFRPLPPTDAEPRDGAGQPIPASRWEQPWTPAEILADHPTGREFAPALHGELAPLLTDARGEVLSFPPVINSASLGRVKPGMRELFVEVTGTTLDQVLLAANVLAANLADRGATIERVETRYPYDTPRGRQVGCPHPLADRRSVEVPLGEFGRLLGEPELARGDVERWLRAFGVAVEGEGSSLRVTSPAYRLDYLHPVDAIEDFAISRGYDAFSPCLPEAFTVGGLAPETDFSDRAREIWISCGFEEAIGNLLTSASELREKLLLPDEASPSPAPLLHGGPLVRIQNVMNANYEVVRDWVLPTLLEVERRSSSAPYPHRVFEAGEVSVWDPAANLKSRGEQRLAALICDAELASFTDMQAIVDEFLRRHGLSYGREASPGTYTLVLRDHPSFIPGRAAWVHVGDEELGVFGELHPELLDRWGLYLPVAACELRLDALERALG